MIYEQITALFNEFNTKLFKAVLGEEISPCIITLNRKNKTFSGNYFAHYISLDKSVSSKSELFLNPDYFGVRPRIELLQSLVHEMMHLYQHEPYRVCRRVNILRDYPDDKTKLYPRN